MLPLPLRRFARLLALLAGLAAAEAARADGGTLLTVTAETRRMTFDRAALERLRQVTYRTGTIWTEGVQEFRGVPLSEVLKAAGVTGSTLVLHAVNDYAADMPMAGVTAEVPMIALTLNGRPMSLREKGPLWLVYPYDLSTAYQSEVVYTQSVWQLERVDVLP